VLVYLYKQGHYTLDAKFAVCMVVVITEKMAVAAWHTGADAVQLGCILA
jgi:hypothetical protein